ncbi:hypothetical protein [Pedobacter hiemivivus]|uniref:Plasmid transfer protein n=1 Tax=Pedobacter hiemivivus TaxID=2530454 RepID=A0A4R0NHI0_9SPHI|nr:hypothetical protein [Pedobacter hiemivivus]TCC98782.1 hypothetical protein EZ444_05770 [Pedobacter hiemivivus]
MKFMQTSLYVLLMGAGLMNAADAQRIVHDRKHLQAVAENAVVRQAAEFSHTQYLEKIDQNLQNINLNIGSVVIAQNMIYNGLANVNSALKNGIAVRDMGLIISDLISYSRQMLEMAKGEPYLLLFAEDFGQQMKARSARLVTDVSASILKEGNNMLADYNSRDQLLRTVTQELQLLSSLIYGAWKAMFWAKQRGIFRSINPFEAWISNDRIYVEDIIRNAKYLKL